jgi:hypothetical protein
VRKTPSRSVDKLTGKIDWAHTNIKAAQFFWLINALGPLWWELFKSEMKVQRVIGCKYPNASGQRLTLF